MEDPTSSDRAKILLRPRSRSFSDFIPSSQRNPGQTANPHTPNSVSPTPPPRVLLRPTDSYTNLVSPNPYLGGSLSNYHTALETPSASGQRDAPADHDGTSATLHHFPRSQDDNGISRVYNQHGSRVSSGKISNLDYDEPPRRPRSIHGGETEASFGLSPGDIYHHSRLHQHSPSKKNRISTLQGLDSGATDDNDEGSGGTASGRSARRLIRRERAHLSPSDPNYYYTQRTLESDSVSVQPSSTGIDPLVDYVTSAELKSAMVQQGAKSAGTPRHIHFELPENQNDGSQHVDNNKEKMTDDLSDKLLQPGTRRKLSRKTKQPATPTTGSNTSLSNSDGSIVVAVSDIPPTGAANSNSKKGYFGPSVWQVYCNVLTFIIPAYLLRTLGGMKSKQRQQAWREKIGLISVIMALTVFVGFFTFAFNSAVCGQHIPRVHYKKIPTDSAVVHGTLYNISTLLNSADAIYERSETARPDALEIWQYAGASDASLLFQNVNGNCANFVSSELKNHPVPMTLDKQFSYYYPCVLLNLNGSPRGNPLQQRITHRGGGGGRFGRGPDGASANAAFCHLPEGSRDYLYNLGCNIDVYYSWQDLKDINNDLVVYLGDVIDLTRLQMLRAFTINEHIVHLMDTSVSIRGKDISVMMSGSKEKRMAAKCMVELAKIGVVDTDTLGCIASNLVLIISLTFIVSIVVVKFVFALYFEWFMSWRLGANFAHVPLSNAASGIRSIRHGVTSAAESLDRAVHKFADSRLGSRLVLHDSTLHEDEEQAGPGLEPTRTVDTDYTFTGLLSPSQRLHTICLVTAYSEDEKGLRATLDSIAVCSYPNTHKLVIVICDGLIIGSGNKDSTPEIAVAMIKDFVIPPNECGMMPYIAVAQGAKRLNMAKVYAGFYDYDDETVAPQDQVPIPIICIVKCGDQWERETTGVKPGNRGKRDSQVMLMSFLQKVMFNERMTDFEHTLYYTIWQLTKRDVMDYDTVLMVDADTRIRKDSLEHMIGCLVQDHMIMGLCGETQIANKKESWVTMIQVFEYFISHHLTKSFESVFGGVTCLPGCFSMYRIKAPKGPRGYWVPILANPDVVERYAINAVETLHEKNLLLLGEDRYLSTLMLKTFPTRKQIFVPQAKCETTAPSEFRVLLDQRRRWINSTVHNLMELIIVRDLCGVFCISMQFVVLIEFIGTLTLPAALLFSIFVVSRAVVERPVPVIPLILLGLIVGIPGLLIVVTAHQWTYVLWMLIYLISLPIWNFILPLNACK